jgi:hypothetical protein
MTITPPGDDMSRDIEALLKKKKKESSQRGR